MKSFLKQIQEKFIVIESAEYCDSCNRPMDQCVCKDEEIDADVDGARVFDESEGFVEKEEADKEEDP